MRCECGKSIEDSRVNRHLVSKEHRAWATRTRAEERGHRTTVRETWNHTKEICAALADGNGLARGNGYYAVYVALAPVAPFLLEAIREEP